MIAGLLKVTSRRGVIYLAKKIVSVSLLDNTFQYLEAEKQPGGFFPYTPSSVITQESLMTACRKADQIYINGLFPTALYEWELFPKVAKRYLNTLVTKDAEGKLGLPSSCQVQYKTIQEVTDVGVAKWQIAYIALDEAITANIWDTFKAVRKKIKIIAPLPVALSAMIARTDQPQEDFLTVWVSETSSIISITTPDGLVKVARNIPLGLPKKDLPDNPDLFKQFSSDLSKEISMTLTFFKQQFRETVPETLYLVGNPHLQRIFENQPLSGLSFDIHYTLSKSPVEGISEDQVNELIHLIGNFYLPEDFNFLPREEIISRKTGVAFKTAYAALALLIIAGGFWGLQLIHQKSKQMNEFNNKFSQIQTLQKEVKILRQDVSRLKPFEGWKQLYQDTFQNQPRWNMLLSELGLLTPSNIVIENYQIVPGKGSEGTIWNSQMSGKIKAKNWQEGLNLLRQFGGTLQASPFFDVTDIQYAPKEMKQATKTFDFQIALMLSPEELAHEI